MRGMRVNGLLCACLLMGLPAACAEPTGQTAISESSAEPVQQADFESEAALSPMLKELGPAGRRMNLIVLPGDASVEVDRVPVRRKNGVIVLTGKLGQEFRVHVYKGAPHITENITIEDNRPSIPVIDLRQLLQMRAPTRDTAIPGALPFSLPPLGMAPGLPPVPGPGAAASPPVPPLPAPPLPAPPPIELPSPRP